MFKYITHIMAMMVVCITVNASNELSYDLLEKNLKTYQQKIQTIRQNLDSSIFDDQELLLKLDFDADTVIQFMQEKVAFQPYQGLLRGVQGTLNSRSGNSLDQSILLAKLLKDAGFEARIASGVLTEEQSLKLLMQSSNASIPQNIGNGENFDKAVSVLAKKNTNSDYAFDWKNTKTFERYNNSLNQLQNVLKQYEIDLAEFDVTEQMVKENMEYFWVQYRLGVTESWQNAHPVLKKGESFNTTATETFSETVSEKYLHQVKIESFIEQRIGENYKTHSLMNAWTKPTANLQGVFLSYANMPLGIDIKSDFNLQEVISRSQVFMPTFNGQPVGGKVFDLQGRLVDSDAMSAPAAGIFKTVGDKTMNAIDALENNKKPKLELTAQWLQFTFISPDGKEKVVKRYTYKADKNESVDENLVKTKLLTRYEMMVNTGEQPLAYLADLYLQSVENGLPWLKASVDKLFSEKKQGEFPKSIPESSFDLLLQSRWMKQNPTANTETLQYISEPNLIAFKKGYVDAQTEFFAVDIISNSKKFLRVKNGKVYNDTKQTFEQGVWDTAGEWLPSRFLSLEGNEVDTLRVTSAAENQNISLRLLKPETGAEENLSKLFSKDSLAYESAMADINAGYSLIVPEKKPESMKMSGWWRFNTMTGESLGMTADGGGQEITEYEIELAQIALMLARSLGNLQKCDMDGSMNNFEKMCCMAEAHFNNVVGLSFGGALAGSIGTAGAAVFDIVDLLMNWEQAQELHQEQMVRFVRQSVRYRIFNQTSINKLKV